MFKLLIGRIWPYIAGMAGLIVGFFFVRLSGKAAGKQEARQEINEAERKASERARHVENETAAMGDDAVTGELIRDWVRDGKR